MGKSYPIDELKLKLAELLQDSKMGMSGTEISNKLDVNRITMAKYLKVLAAEAIPNVKEIPGTVLDSQLTISCGEGALRIQTLQRPGGGALDAASFLRGYSLPIGTILPCPAIS